MARRLTGLVTLAALGCAAAASLRAGDEPPPSIPLAVVVTDARGRTVGNLTVADFEIIEAGEKRSVASVSAPSNAPRTVGLLLDEFHVSPGAPTDRVRTSVRTFIDRYLKADDVVFVMKPLDAQIGLVAAASLDDVRDRVSTFSGRKGDYAPRTVFEQEYMSAAPAMAARQRAQVVRSGLEALAVAMREPRDAAKALIIVTEGFASEQRDRIRAMTLRSTARAAALSNIPVYVLDPSGDDAAERPFNALWMALTAQTGGTLVSGVPDLGEPLTRIGTDLASQVVVRFQSSGKQDGGFHGLELKSRRAGTILRAPSGYWAPFPPSRFATPESRIDFGKMLTPHLSGQIQPWFRMSPGDGGRTRVTFLWTPRRDGTAASVEFAALTFEGKTVHEAVVAPAAPAQNPAAQTSFEVVPGPLQVSMAITTEAKKWLGRDVRYVDVPQFDPARPVIAAVEFIRPRSLPEFTALQARPDAVPTAVRDFVRQDRLLVRVRAFAGVEPAEVRVRMLNRAGQLLLELPQLAWIDGAAQFDLPFARYARGEYRLEIRASGAGQSTTQILLIRLIG